MPTNSMHDLCVYSADGGITHCGLTRPIHFYLRHKFKEARAQVQEPNPTCAGQEEHTPDEGEPHPATECESRGCVKMRKQE